MREEEYLAVERRIKQKLAQLDIAGAFLGTIFLDWSVIPKRYLYPALAQLLDLECECRTIECRGCEDVEEWLSDLSYAEDDPIDEEVTVITKANLRSVSMMADGSLRLELTDIQSHTEYLAHIPAGVINEYGEMILPGALSDVPTTDPDRSTKRDEQFRPERDTC